MLIVADPPRGRRRGKHKAESKVKDGRLIVESLQQVLVLVSEERNHFAVQHNFSNQ
jgi:hypothetical protein